MEQRLTKRQAAIIGAFTGFTVGPFADIHEYAEEVFGRPCWTHEFGNEEFAASLKEKARADFLAICHKADD